MWALLLQRRLKGKTQEVFSSLPVSDFLNYEKVERVVLSAYLVREVYQQCFASFRKPLT